LATGSTACSNSGLLTWSTPPEFHDSISIMELSKIIIPLIGSIIPKFTSLEEPDIDVEEARATMFICCLLTVA